MVGMVAIPWRACADATGRGAGTKRGNTGFLGDLAAGVLTNFDRSSNWIMRLKKYYRQMRKCRAEDLALLWHFSGGPARRVRHRRIGGYAPSGGRLAYPFANRSLSCYFSRVGKGGLGSVSPSPSGDGSSGHLLYANDPHDEHRTLRRRVFVLVVPQPDEPLRSSIDKGVVHAKFFRSIPYGIDCRRKPSLRSRLRRT
jgi:hypothetical protein